MNNRFLSSFTIGLMLIVGIIISLYQKPPITSRAEEDGVGINFTVIEAPISDNSVWRWRADLTADKHIGETITIQYGVYWCKNSSGQTGEGVGKPCDPNAFLEGDNPQTLIFTENPLQIKNTTFVVNHKGVSCGRIQIDIGGLGGILGGDTYDTGKSCDTAIPTIPPVVPTVIPTTAPFSFFPYENPESTGTDAVASDQQTLLDIISSLFGGLLTTDNNSESPTNNPPPNNPPPNNNKTFMTIRELFNEIGQKVGLPPKILEGILIIESARSFNLSPEEILNYSIPGNEMPNCPISICSARGPMQMTTGVDKNYNPACPLCKAAKGRCPNAWSSYGPAVNTYGGDSHTSKWCNIRDNIYAAAAKLKNDAQALSTTEWTKDEVINAARGYFGFNSACTYKFVRDGISDTYCGHLWRYYKLW